jgi:hyaluronoglucosaminidase
VAGEANFSAGVIEGFFGRSWDWSARHSCADFLQRHGYQFYIYAPKSDPYLRRRWREPLPGETARQLNELSVKCRRSGLRFGIGLTPFEIYLNYDAAARLALRSKVRQLNDVGVDLLCILFDDMRGDVEGIAQIQARIIADICAWSDAGRFIVCPTYYSYDSRLTREFGLPPKTYLRDFGRLVDAGIDIFWTGEKIISAGYSAEHLTDVAAQIGRRPFIWDNHSSNDSKIRTNYLYLDPSTTAWSLPVSLAAGLAINPMNQAYLARIAVSGYQSLLAQASGAGRCAGFAEICRALCGSLVGPLIAENTAAFRDIGLSDLDAENRRALLARYEAEPSNDHARDIAAWLRGEYVFDPQCLTT